MTNKIKTDIYSREGVPILNLHFIEYTKMVLYLNILLI